MKKKRKFKGSLKNKKAQIKLFESIAVLIIFIFLVSIGMKFYTASQLNSLKEAQKKISKLDSVKTAIELSNLPELACSKQGVFDKSCIDLNKLNAWTTKINDKENLRFRDYYYSSLGQSKITLKIIYPPHDHEFKLYDASRESENSDHIFVPINVYDPATKRNMLAIINIKTYYG